MREAAFQFKIHLYFNACFSSYFKLFKYFMIFKNQNSACCKWFWWKQVDSLDKNNDYHCHLHKGESSKRQGARGGVGGKRWGAILTKNLTHYLQLCPSWNTTQSKTGPVSELFFSRLARVSTWAWRSSLINFSCYVRKKNKISHNWGKKDHSFDSR